MAPAQVAGNSIHPGGRYLSDGARHLCGFSRNQDGKMLSTFRITATNPPTIFSVGALDKDNGGCGSPFVTSTDGSSNTIVWVIGTLDPCIRRATSGYTVMMERPGQLFTMVVVQTN